MSILSSFNPTPFDHSPSVFFNHDDPRRGWHVMPVFRTKMLDAIADSNFRVVIRHLESLRHAEAWEVHRFNHWGPGWFEIIIFDPQCTPICAYAEEVQSRLEDYPILDECDLACYDQ